MSLFVPTMIIFVIACILAIVQDNNINNETFK